MEVLRRFRFLILILLLLGISFVAYNNKLYVKSILKRSPKALRVVQTGKKFINEKIVDRINKPKPRIKNKQVQIRVDASAVLEKFESFWGGFGHDQFYSGVTAPNNRAFFRLIEQANQQRQVFTFFRAHNIFSDMDAPNGDECGGKVYQEDANGNPIYNWDRVNEFFDILLKSRLKPIVEFSFMPDALTSDPKRIGNWRKANVAPPKDYEKWKNLVYETVVHLQNRYGKSEIESWYYEVWNEPDLWHHFWVPDPTNKNKTYLEEYYKLYDYTTAGAKLANPNIKLGGPAIAGWANVLEGVLDHATNGKNFVDGTRGTPLDFYSFHKYGKVEDVLLKKTKQYVEIAQYVSKEKFSKTPFLIDEIAPAGTRYKPEWKNTPYVSAWMCQAVDGFLDLGYKKGKHYKPAMMIYWDAVGKDFKTGKCALASVVGTGSEHIVKGPVVNAYDALSYLGNERLLLEGTNFGDFVHGIATRHSDKSVEILLYHIDKPTASGSDSVEINLNVENLPFDKYYVRHFRIDAAHSNAYGLWKKMSSPVSLTKTQIKTLEENDDLQLIQPVYQPQTAERKFSKTVTMETNSVDLIVLTRVSQTSPPEKPAKLKADKISTNSISLTWRSPSSAGEKSEPQSYLIYRNDFLLGQTVETNFTDSGLLDYSHYHYKIYSVDDQGNISREAAVGNFATLKDAVQPEITNFVMDNPTSIMIYFNKPLDRGTAAQKLNFSIDNGIEIRSVFLDQKGKKLLLSTAPHLKGESYTLTMKNIHDQAKAPNFLKTEKYLYKFVLSYVDFFEKNSVDQYAWTSTNFNEKKGAIKYDSQNMHLEVLTGDNVQGALSHSLPQTSNGVFRFLFFPDKNYPNGGKITLKLIGDQNNYYRLTNTDGYGPGKIEKCFSGIVADSENFKREYSQNKSYQIEIQFQPEFAVVKAFGEILKLNRNGGEIKIRKFEISLAQQDAFIDDIFFQAK